MQQRLGPSPESSQWCQPTKCYRYLEDFYLRLWNEHYKYPLKLVIFFFHFWGSWKDLVVGPGTGHWSVMNSITSCKPSDGNLRWNPELQIESDIMTGQQMTATSNLLFWWTRKITFWIVVQRVLQLNNYFKTSRLYSRRCSKWILAQYCSLKI